MVRGMVKGCSKGGQIGGLQVLVRRVCCTFLGSLVTDMVSSNDLLAGYCYKIPDILPSHLAAPLLCAGITVYTPMMRHNMNQPSKSLGVIAFGDMAVMFGKAFGLKVTVFSTSMSKKEEALSILGADN
ncbi:putative cinnamyl alcohol dehydrogenase 1 [Silene latifolia]|uniref:putative cinnamyl alcohol dehydrogenase 1 n=1 Tax=Silene latifolia TaxID=37657 RepID=UPI003D771E5C